ncbi:MAG: ATP synthase F1 subunit epsilon [Myxococcales bacterium]|nr:ATP synthase F1 subunit epsilon [Myxococcales bacterium]
MADKIELEIVTPKGRALAASVDEVTAPSVQGEFGVMPGHLPVLAAIRTGLVTYRQGAETKKCAVGAGFAEAGHNKLLILSDEYIEREGVDPVRVRKELAEVEGRLEKLAASSDSAGDADAQSERKSLIDRENWLAVQLELYGDPPPPTMRPFEEWGPPASAAVVEDEHADKAG